MTNKEELIANLEIAEQRKKIAAMIENKEIAIDWETDVSKIDLSVLRSTTSTTKKAKITTANNPKIIRRGAASSQASIRLLLILPQR